jgi:16S rRNA (guanine966-N2)-methyltransferase
VPRSLANAVRIIGGRCRGRIVRFPASDALRPTPDRVRETLFNWLGQDLSGLATLEPYAGSGALSLEALSRGARLAVAVDRDPRLVAALRDNAVLLALPGLEVHRADAEAFLAQEGRRFDVVFLDPPFADDPWSWLLPACRTRLADGGAIYVESARPIAAPAGLAVVRQRRAGQVVYHLLRADGGSAPAPGEDR